MAGAAGLIGVAARALLQPAIGDSLPFILAAPLTVFSAMMWGGRAGLLTATIGLVGTLLPGVPPDVLNAAGWSSASIYAVSMAGVCILIDRLGLLRRGASHDEQESQLVKWLNAVLVGAILLPATVFCVIAWWSFDRAQANAVATVERRLSLVYDHAIRTLGVAQELATQAGVLTDGPADRVRASEPELRQRLFDMLMGVPSVINVNVWDESARPLVRSDRNIDLSAEVSDRQYFQEQRASAIGWGVSERLIGRQTGRPLVNLTMRRPSPTGAFRGVVAVSLAPDYFTNFYRALTADSSGVESIALVRTDGAILVRWPSIEMTHVPPGSPLLQHLRAGEQSAIFTATAPGTKELRIAGFRKLPSVPLCVAVGFSRASMLAAWTRTVELLAAVLMPISIVLVMVTAVARRRVIAEQRAQLDLQQEIRRRADTERSAVEAQKTSALAALTGAVAHDFNNLLAILTNSLVVHEMRHPLESDEPQLLAMRRALQSGTRLTRQLLSFTRKQALRPESIHLQAWLPDAGALLRATLGASVTLSCEVAPDTAPIYVDAAELELALINLAMNAKHAQPDGGSFSIVAANSSNHPQVAPAAVCISASDRGHGIPEALVSRVVEPFFTTKENGAGSGLGLSQVQGMMNRARGILSIQSKQSQGTTVELVFPAHLSGTDGLPAELAEVTNPQDLHGCILLVEDNEDVAAMTAALLSSLGLEVLQASSATDALHILETTAARVGFVLSDVAMPGDFDGIQLALILRAQRPELPVLLVTGYSDNIELATSAGVQVVQKPISLRELGERLGRVFPSREMGIART